MMLKKVFPVFAESGFLTTVTIYDSDVCTFHLWVEHGRNASEHREIKKAAFGTAFVD